MHKFKLILISDENFSIEYIPFIKWAFANGLDRFHLRKKAANQELVNTLLAEFSETERSKISIHYHHDKESVMSLKVGLHFSLDHLKTISSKEEIKSIPKSGRTNSFSIHHWEELHELPEHIDYAFISPVYPSISKPGYRNESLLANISPISQNTPIEIIALGGIQSTHLKELHAYGFAGAAILGAVWQSKDPYAAMLLFFESRP